MNKKRVKMILALIIGFALLVFFIYRTGLDAVLLLIKNLNWFYFSIYFLLTALTFVFLAWRWKVIIDCYGKKISFWMLLRQVIAGFGVAYVTPSARLGGDPVKVYMLKKEAGIDYKTGSTSIILDRFVDLAGVSLLGIIGLSMFFYFPSSFLIRMVLGVALFIIVFAVFGVYFRTIYRKGSFSSVFRFFRLHKLKKIGKFVKTLEHIEKQMHFFFVKHRNKLFLACFIYLLYGITMLLEVKFLLLSFGVDLSWFGVILALTTLGAANFLPVPGGIGFLEAGQSGLFFVLVGKESVGFAAALLMRLNALIFTAIGFVIISFFTSGEMKKIKNLEGKIK